MYSASTQHDTPKGAVERGNCVSATNEASMDERTPRVRCSTSMWLRIVRYYHYLLLHRTRALELRAT